MEKLVMILAGVVIALQFADYKTTVAGLEAGAVEKNPLSKALGTKVAKLIAALVVIGLAVVYHYSPSELIPGMLGVVGIYYAWVVYNNIRIKKLLERVKK